MKPQTLQKTALALLVGWYAANAAAYFSFVRLI